ncbi:MAG TPA: phenylalanine 4-monooxygenase [Pyrinomonadaceae bacterium]|jgi:phenylalanine-4-hydroxylase
METVEPRQQLLSDHGDMRPVAEDEGASADRNSIVRLSPDHPGFRDAEYRARRNRIARLALEHRAGEPVPDAPYTEEEHGVWRAIREALEPAHESHACAEYLECVRRLELPRDRIPQMREVSERVEACSGFRLEPVAGLVEPRVFLETLARGVFLSTQYIRHHSAPLYTPEPDVAHEVLGHAVTLASEPLAEINRLFGEAVRRTREASALERLSRVYWFTVEFGVLREGGGVKAYGAGLLSSAGELEAMRGAELRPLDIEAASRTRYDPTRYQPVLFCADSFREMRLALGDFLARWRG